MTQAEQLLKTAWSHMLDAEKELPDLTAVRQSLDASADSSSGTFTGNFTAVLKNRWALNKKTKQLLEEISLAEKQAAAAAALDPNVSTTVTQGKHTGQATVSLVNSVCAAMSASVLVASGDLRGAETKFRQSLQYWEDPETYQLLAYTLMDLKRPREAVTVLEKAIALDPEGETGTTARKELGRLNAKKIFGDHWFVGSWKIAGFLAVFAVCSIGLAFMPKSFLAGLFNLFIWGGSLALYMKFKLK